MTAFRWLKLTESYFVSSTT